MAPKVKITKDDIINTAVEIVRKNGAEAINARNVAAALGCSTQPVFSNFSSMDELKLAVIHKADGLCQKYIRNECEKGEYPFYKASGMAYIRFAKEEKELFKLLYMRDRSKELGSDSVDSPLNDSMISLVQGNTGLDDRDASLFHLEMWAVVHGIATMLATGFLELDFELISKILTDSYLGMRKQYGME